MNKKPHRWWKIVLGIVAAVLLIVIVYVAYAFLTSTRIEDNLALDVQHRATADEVAVGEEYAAVTYNVGFGAYTPDYTFFMDGGVESWARSEQSVIDCINGAADVITGLDVDFALIQEVDTDSTRSYHVDEAAMLCDRFSDRSAVFAQNYHSPFLMYPLTQPHGKSNSGIMTFSDVDIVSSLRRSLPVSQGVGRILDLDRCYSVSRIDVDNGRQLVLYNTHLSAYGTDGDLQAAQMRMLFDDMNAEYQNGNYVVCGGDWNHDFTGSSKDAFNDTYEDYTWAADFPDALIPGGFFKVTDYQSGMTVPSCRNNDVPYGDDCFTVILDGFIVSGNVETTYVDIIDTGFLYSDHNPVLLRFRLK